MPIYDWNNDKKQIARSLSNVATLKICAKVLDEPLLIEDWIVHHSAIVGLENLIIADNFSTDPTTLTVYAKYGAQLTVIRFEGSHDTIHWDPRFGPLFDVLRQTCRYFSFIDVDERLVILENDRWGADAAIVSRIERASPTDIIPATWIINRLYRYDEFQLFNEYGNFTLETNLMWGKPLLPANLIGVQAGIHNIQFGKFKFARELGTSVFLLHLTQFPERRLISNRNQLVSRGIVPKGSKVEEVIAMSFEHLQDLSFMPVVDDMKRMQGLLDAGVRTDERLDKGTLHLKPGGAIEVSTPQGKTLLETFLVNGRDIVDQTFDREELGWTTMDDRTEHLDRALQLRDQGDLSRAKRLLRRGMELYPDLLDIAGQPAFAAALKDAPDPEV